MRVGGAGRRRVELLRGRKRVEIGQAGDLPLTSAGNSGTSSLPATNLGPPAARPLSSL
jgi:hypothetical protein